MNLANFNGLVAALDASCWIHKAISLSYSWLGENKRREFFMFIPILVFCAVYASRLLTHAFLYIQLDRNAVERSLSPNFCGMRWIYKRVGRPRAASHIFVICIILLSLCARDVRKKYDCSQCFFHCFCSFLVCFFYLRVKEIYISFLDLLERTSIRPLAFSGRFPGSLATLFTRSLY